MTSIKGTGGIGEGYLEMDVEHLEKEGAPLPLAFTPMVEGSWLVDTLIMS